MVTGTKDRARNRAASLKFPIEVIKDRCCQPVRHDARHNLAIIAHHIFSILESLSLYSSLLMIVSRCQRQRGGTSTSHA